MTIPEEDEKDLSSPSLPPSLPPLNYTKHSVIRTSVPTAMTISPLVSKEFSVCSGYFKVQPSLFPVLGDGRQDYTDCVSSSTSRTRWTT